ncbi:MAG: hypothetical protein K6B28_11250 [Lachnospiraceae bacterium]|nr:hypothetical protein [Lachnospiraceae bacterium]
MLDEEKIRLMTKMAAYEAGEGRKDVNINSFFRGDYLSLQIWKSAVYGTVGFIIYAVMSVLYDLQDFLENFYKMDVAGYFKDLLIKYAVVLGIYIVISYFVYLYRYIKGKKHLKRYIKALNEIYGMSRR